MNENVKTLLFDFDGTLVDSLPVFVEITNRLGREFGFRGTTVEEVRAKSARVFLRDVRLPWYKLPFVLRRGRAYYAERIESLGPAGNVLEVAETLKENGFELGILTTNIESTVERFLRHHRCRAFSRIYSAPRLFGKARALKKITRLIPAESILYIGDEVRDIEAAHQCGVKAVAVGWGFNGPEALRQPGPEFEARVPADLLRLSAVWQGARTDGG